MEINFTPFLQQRQKKENRPKAKERKPSRTTFIDLTGKRFGRWTVLHESPKPKGGQTRWHCRCVCGKEKPAVLYGGLVSGASKSCGCLRMEGLVKPTHQIHGQRNPTYRVWQGMRTRCYNVMHPSYRRYGARGITICPQWQDDFDQFLKDMGPRPEGMTIERKDNVDYACLRYHVFHRGRPLQTAISILRAQGQVGVDDAQGDRGYERAQPWGCALVCHGRRVAGERYGSAHRHVHPAPRRTGTP